MNQTSGTTKLSVWCFLHKSEDRSCGWIIRNNFTHNKRRRKLDCANKRNNSNLYEVSFTDANNGTNSGILGNNPSYNERRCKLGAQTSGTTNDLFGDMLYRCEQRNHSGPGWKILCMTNGGANWIVQTSGTTIDLLGIFYR